MVSTVGIQVVRRSFLEEGIVDCGYLLLIGALKLGLQRIALVSIRECREDGISSLK